MEDLEDKYEKFLTQIDKKEKKSFIKLVGFSMLIVSLAAIFIFVTINVIRTKDSTITEKSNEISIRDSVYSELNEDVLITFEELNSVQLDSTTRAKIEITKLRINRLPEMISQEGPTVVRYYKRDNDDPAISRIIEQMGFDLNIRPVDHDDGEVKVNTIWYGDSVKVEELRLLSQQLLMTNNSFKEIKKFKLHQDYRWKIKAIEIGYAAKYDSLLTLSEKDLPSKLDNARKWKIGMQKNR